MLVITVVYVSFLLQGTPYKYYLKIHSTVNIFE